MRLPTWTAVSSSSHGGIRVPLPSALARLRVALAANSRMARRTIAVSIAVLLLVLLQQALTQAPAITPQWRLRFMRDGDLPFGGFARRAQGFESVPAMLRSTVNTVLIAHPDWRDALESAGNTGEALLEVPSIATQAHESRLLAALCGMPRLSDVVVHGVPPGALKLAAALRRVKPSIRVSFLLFGGEPDGDLHAVVDAVLRGDIYRLGWVRTAMVPKIGGILGISSLSILLAFPGLPLLVPEVRYSDRDGGVTRHIGMLGLGLRTEDTLTQLLASCMLPGVVVHVADAPGAADLSRCASPVVVHGAMPAPLLFDRVLSRMDLNLFTAASEGAVSIMAVLHSLALGVPALISPMLQLYAADPVLEAALVIPRFKDRTALQAAILGALENRDELASRSRALLEWLHANAGVELATFLGRKFPGGGNVISRSLDERAEGDKAATRFGFLPDGGSKVVPPSLPYPAFHSPVHEDYAFSKATEDAPPTSPSPRKLRIAMGTYELAPMTAGGAGVVTAALALDMLVAGHDVTILAHMDCESAHQWDLLTRGTVARELSVLARRTSSAESDIYASQSSAVTTLAAREAQNADDVGMTGDDDSSAHLSQKNVSLRTICVPDLLAQSSEAQAELRGMRRSGNLWINRARDFSVAARLAYDDAPFDMLELFDYAGIGFELTRDRWRHRLASWNASTDGLPPVVVRQKKVDFCDSMGNGAGEGSERGATRRPFLPLHVPIVVRAHGTLQLIDQYEGAATAQAFAAAATDAGRAVGAVVGGGAGHVLLPLRFDPSVNGRAGFDPGDDAQLTLMYRMEQWTLAAADVVLAQSPAMQDLYVRAYGLRPRRGRVLLGQPPMRRVLQQFRTPGSVSFAGFKARVARPLTPMVNQQGRRNNDGVPTVLVYGKLQVLKGTETVVDALVRLASVTDGSLPRFRVAFVGLDTPCPRHSRLASACIRKALSHLVNPPAASRGDASVARGPLAEVEVLPPIKRDEVPAFIAGMATGPALLLGAVLASELETFSMALHELASVGVPLVASSIPAFDAVGDRAPFRFAVGNATDLARAITALLTDEVARGRSVSQPPMEYDDPLAPYQEIAQTAAAAAWEGRIRGGPGAVGDIGAASMEPLQLQLVDAAVRRACEAAHVD